MPSSDSLISEQFKKKDKLSTYLQPASSATQFCIVFLTPFPFGLHLECYDSRPMMFVGMHICSLSMADFI